MINKFLYPNGGSETYIFKLGNYLKTMGHSVEYFGMEHEGRCVGNSVNAYTSDMDFHTASGLKKISYALKTIYSVEARKKIRLVLDNFRPDVCHLNNFNYQLTPSIILEIKKWSKETNHPCKIVYTAHDYQLVCPNHMCNNPNTMKNCEKCLSKNYMNCIKGKCIHGSTLKSVLGAMEAKYWDMQKVYENIDTIICCSNFLKSKLDSNPILATKTITLHNFTTKEKTTGITPVVKKDYVLYFGRYSQEKGIETLINACKALPNIPFVFAGVGSDAMLNRIRELPNVTEVGFLSGETLETTIQNAKFSIYPSEWYENCPFSIIESQMLGTPVIGANIGGIPELIDNMKTGMLFDSGSVNNLVNFINALY
jgi:glycosyltransferase involved in cell wall biosynthesis